MLILSRGPSTTSPRRFPHRVNSQNCLLGFPFSCSGSSSIRSSGSLLLVLRQRSIDMSQVTRRIDDISHKRFQMFHLCMGRWCQYRALVGSRVHSGKENDRRVADTRIARTVRRCGDQGKIDRGSGGFCCITTNEYLRETVYICAWERTGQVDRI